MSIYDSYGRFRFSDQDSDNSRIVVRINNVRNKVGGVFLIKRPYFHVKPLDKRQIKNWNDYLDFEISEGDPLRIIPLFERCLVSCALYEDFWCRYALYMEKHTQNVLSEKEEVLASDKNADNDGNKNVCEDEKVTKNALSESVESEKEIDSAEKSCEANKEEDSSDGVNIDKQVNDQSITVINSKDDNTDTMVRGSDVKNDKDFPRDVNVEVRENRDSTIGNDAVEKNLREQIPIIEIDDRQNSNVSDIVESENEGQSVEKTEPPTLEQLKSELCADLNISGRVLKCPPLTPQWIKSGVSWEDVRHIYRRGAWIHCPSKAGLLMQWAEFEETQGNLDTSRELLSTVVTKYPTLLKARMHLIELERRAGYYQRVEELYAEASRAFTQPRQRSWLAIKYARFLLRLVITENMLKNYEEKVIKLEQENEGLKIEFCNLKGSIFQQEEVNKELEKYKEKIKETYAQVVKEKETIKEVCLEVKIRNDQQQAEVSPPASNTWTKEELDDKREGLIMVMRDIIAQADKNKSRLLILENLNFKAIDWEAYEARTEDFWTCRFVKDNIQRLKMGTRFTEYEKEMCETLNEKFQSVFVQNEIFREPDTIRIPENNIECIEVSRDEVENMLKELISDDRATEILQERDGWVDCIYLDLKKAFNRVLHKRLFWKLEHIEVVTGFSDQDSDNSRIVVRINNVRNKVGGVFLQKTREENNEEHKNNCETL
ncbi:repetitive organellar protein-like [Procambarus clarkii]|uniref:repetitive organellar protein-like n=1 Tax=Procambarus clarkii TaxID=6728 RepID=UPI003742A2CE